MNLQIIKKIIDEEALVTEKIINEQISTHAKDIDTENEKYLDFVRNNQSSDILDKFYSINISQNYKIKSVELEEKLKNDSELKLPKVQLYIYIY